MLIPPDIKRQAQLIKLLETTENLSPSQKNQLDQARLAVAKWSLQCEGLPVTYSNLSATLGTRGQDSLSAVKEFLGIGSGREPDRAPIVVEKRPASQKNANA